VTGTLVKEHRRYLLRNPGEFVIRLEPESSGPPQLAES
jgi:hypothetical protein